MVIKYNKVNNSTALELNKLVFIDSMKCLMFMEQLLLTFIIRKY